MLLDRATNTLLVKSVIPEKRGSNLDFIILQVALLARGDDL